MVVPESMVKRAGPLLALSLLLAGGCTSGPKPAKEKKAEPSIAAAPTAPTEPKLPVTAAAKGIGPDSEFRISESDRCPVCAMKIAEHVKTAAAVELKDGRTFYTCGNGCALRCWLSPEKHLGVGLDQRERILVRDYFTGQETDAHEMLFIAGSDVMGPMGPMPVAVKPDQKEVFTERHGGTELFRVGELDAAGFAAIIKRVKERR